MRKVVFLSFALIASGCTTSAGPYVTNISSGGEGKLVIEKCMVELNRFITMLSNKDCRSTTIQVVQ